MKTGIEIYEPYLNDADFIEAWRRVCFHTDGCSSGFLLKTISSILLFFRGGRKFKCCCKDHDFDFREGWRWGMTLEVSNAELGCCVNSSGKWVKRFWIGGAMHFGTDFGGKGSFRGNWSKEKLQRKEDEEHMERVKGGYYKKA